MAMAMAREVILKEKAKQSKAMNIDIFSWVDFISFHGFGKVLPVS